MFAHSVVSWTVDQLSCNFSVTIAGFPVLDSAIPHTPKFCVPTFGNGQNNAKTVCICLYGVWFLVGGAFWRQTDL